MEAAEALREIKKQIHIPLVADIHFDYKLAIAAIEAGADKIRINPGNIGSEERVRKVVEKAKDHLWVASVRTLFPQIQIDLAHALRRQKLPTLSLFCLIQLGLSIPEFHRG